MSASKINIGVWVAVLCIGLNVSFSGCRKNRARPNILLVTVDTLRQDRLGTYGYTRATSPFIDRLAVEGTVFEYAFTPLPSTTASIATILTSLHPLVHDALNLGSQLQDNVVTMAEVLKKGGYFTVGAVAVKHLSGRANFSQGFDVFSDTWDVSSEFNSPEQRAAESVNRSLIEMLDVYKKRDHRKPLFMWVHYFDPHNPYIDHKDIEFERDAPVRPNNPQMNNYDAEIRYTDNCIKDLFEKLKAEEITGNMVTCITADHGEQFFEHGNTFCHADIYSETTLVPLVFHGTGIPNGRRVQNPVSTMDIAKTLLQSTGLEFKSRTSGRDLSPYFGVIPLDIQENRNFLIMGYPAYTRSLQIVQWPNVFIWNLDSHYEKWYLSDKPPPVGTLVQNLPHQTRGKTTVHLEIPYPEMNIEWSEHFTVLHVHRQSGQSLPPSQVQVIAKPYQATAKIPVGGDKTDVYIYYPTTLLDELSVLFDIETQTQDIQFRWGVIRKSQLPDFDPSETKSNAVFSQLRSPRKNHPGNECFDIQQDKAMINNLLVSPHIPLSEKRVFDYRLRIYGLSQRYIIDRTLFFKGRRQVEKMTQEQIDMLKSLGYF